ARTPAHESGGTPMAKHSAPQTAVSTSAGIIRPIVLSAEAYLRLRAATTAVATSPGRHSRG
ncbi:MAG TPA: hypothetical protein VK935_16220, partial [Actinomycetospora sp.]|nr:hypothetical protein [Actinomycetospora sp.]